MVPLVFLADGAVDVGGGLCWGLHWRMGPLVSVADGILLVADGAVDDAGDG